MKNSISLFLASGCYIGLIPGAPGTYASSLTAALYYLACRSGDGFSPSLHLFSVCVITVVGISVSGQVSRSCGHTDPQKVVIDEIAGQLATFLLLPPKALHTILGVVLFRVFDIAKPFPIRRLERLQGGVGIVADDIMAAFYANLLLQMLTWIMPG